MKTCSRVASLSLFFAAMLVQVLVQAQAPAAPPQLTALDYIEIQQLVSKYARAIDSFASATRTDPIRS